MKISDQAVNNLLSEMFRLGGKPNMLPITHHGEHWLRRYVFSGVIATKAKRVHTQRVKAARRRNRGRGSFARFR